MWLKNSDEKNAELIVSEINKSTRNGSKTESNSNDNVEDSQVEGDSSHDEAYNSIIRSYYTTDPFFSGGKDITNLNTFQKERKSFEEDFLLKNYYYFLFTKTKQKLKETNRRYIFVANSI